jgi:hypothetical protein
MALAGCTEWGCMALAGCTEWTTRSPRASQPLKKPNKTILKKETLLFREWRVLDTP